MCKFTVIVQTPQAATQAIINSVNSLVFQRVLKPLEGGALVLVLSAAINQMNNGHDARARDLLNAFIIEVAVLRAAGMLSSSQATMLTAAANNVIAHIP